MKKKDKSKSLVISKKTDLTIKPNQTPAEVIASALQKGSNLEQLEKLMQIQRDWEANEARKLFFNAFSRAQTEISAVVKKKSNPQTHSKYADLADIIQTAKPVYTKFGLSVLFYEGESKEKDISRICADVLHVAGHKETYHIDIPVETTGMKGTVNMTKTHAKASAISYGRRYLMYMIWNIPTPDDDGNLSSLPIKNVEYITHEQQNEIADLLLEKNLRAKPLFEYLGVKDFEEIKKSDYRKAKAAIENAKKK